MVIPLDIGCALDLFELIWFAIAPRSCILHLYFPQVRWLQPLSHALMHTFPIQNRKEDFLSCFALLRADPPLA